MSKLSAGRVPSRCTSCSMLQANQVKLNGHAHEAACTAHASQALHHYTGRCAQYWRQALCQEMRIAVVPLCTIRLCVHEQANIMKMADGLFLRCCREVHERYPNIQYREMIVSLAPSMRSHPCV